MNEDWPNGDGDAELPAGPIRPDAFEADPPHIQRLWKEATGKALEVLRSTWKPEDGLEARQRKLLTGLNCLEGQEELFQTDGQE